jgi:exopolysaccharide biosynthesis polyprenyl glycosylphosphotransferase
MSELTTNHLAGPGPTGPPPQYNRMILGTPGMQPARSAPKTVVISNNASGAGPQGFAKSIPPWTLSRLLLPHPVADSFALYRLVAADLIILAAVCTAQTLFLPALGLPRLGLPVFVVLATLFGFTEGVYRNTDDPFPAGIVPGMTRSVLFATVLVFFGEPNAIRPLAALATCASSLCGLLLYRQSRQLVWARGRHDSEARKVLIVGGGQVARSIAQTLRNDPLHHAEVCGFVDDFLPLSPAVLGRIGDLEWLARAVFIDEIILTIAGQPALTREAAEVAFRNHLDIRAVPDLPPGPWPDSNIDYIGEIPVVTLHREPVPSGALFLKRLVDILGAAFGLVLSGPLMAIVALLIRLESPGPVIYAADRAGVKGRRFRCYKFRSMVTNADHLKADLRAQNQREGPIFKIVGDPRITRVGRFIRRYSLDELPQLWNVLRGDMSMVGPRPHPVDEVNHYELHHYRRLDVKPGITGLWQITARHSPSFDLNMHLDLTYIENWSLRLDFRILLGTVRVLFSPEGA